MKVILFITFSLIISSCSSNLKKTITSKDREPANFKSCLDTMSEMIAYRPFSGPAAWIYSDSKTFHELEEKYGGSSLLYIQQQIDNEEIKKNNLNIRELANVSFKPVNIEGKIDTITTADTQIIYSAMQLSEVNKNHYCYDTKGTIGFCFGRATIAHMEAIARDIHPDSIKKIWIAGDMKEWGHHVATIVYTEIGWMVLDTNIGKPVVISAWLDYYKPFKNAKADKEVMAFVTQAGRFGPYDTRAYNAIDLFNTNSSEYNKAKDYFNGYFYDYFESLDNVLNAPLKPKK